MFQRTTQMLQNQEGGSPGGGSPTPAPAAPAQGAAPSAAPTTVPLDQVKTMISEAVTGAVSTMQDGVFAALRKSGVFKDGNNGGAPPAAPAVAAPPSGGDGNPPKPPPGFIAAIDVEKMISRSNAVIRIAATNQLSDAQVNRMEAALKAANPDDHVAWTNAYLGDFGLLKGAPTAPATPPVTQATTPTTLTPTPGSPQLPPISDKGTPAPAGDVGDFELRLYQNPFGFGGVDRERLIAKHGEAKANAMIVEAGNAKATGVKVHR